MAGYKSSHTGTQVDTSVNTVLNDDSKVKYGNIIGTLSDQTDLQDEFNRKVDKEAGKGLSTNDYTTAEKTKLAGIQAGAQVNTWGTITGNINLQTDLQNALSAKVPTSRKINGQALTQDITIDALPSQTGQSGKFLTTNGTNPSWQEIPTEVDGETISLNTDDELQAIGIKDNRNAATLKYWTGTRAQYTAITNKDSNTIYNITDDTGGTITEVAFADITGQPSDNTNLATALNGKQATLVSGTNIKSINNNSLLGSGNLSIDSLPSQTGQNGKYLTTNGTTASWGEINTGANTDLSNLSATGEAKFTAKQDALGFTPVNKAGDTMTGTLTIDKDNSTALTLRGNITTATVNSYQDIQVINKEGNRVGNIRFQNTATKNRLNFNLMKYGTNSPVGVFTAEVDADGKISYSLPQLITTYVNGTSGYNIWSNGYCEQWGRGPYIAEATSYNFSTNIAFLKTFANTNYNVQVTYKSTGYMDVSIGATDYNTTSFNAYTSWAGDGKHAGFYHVWRACGYLAEGQY